MTELEECNARVAHYTRATLLAQEAWTRYNNLGKPWEKERRRRAYEFLDRMRTNWEDRRDRVRLRVQGRHLRLVS